MRFIFLSALFVSFVAAAEPMNQTQIDIALKYFEQSGQLKAYSDCLGIKPDALKTGYEKSFKECGAPSDDDEKSSQCMKNALKKHLHIAQNAMDSCGKSEDEDPLEKTTKKLDELQSKIGDREPTPAEQKQIDALLAEMQAQGVQKLSETMDNMVQASQGTEEAITLPIYPGAKMMVHSAMSGSMEFAGKTYSTLPTATFASLDTPAQVVNFYKAKLPEFKYIKVAELQMEILIKSVPAEFNYMQHMNQVLATPHVSVQPADAAQQKILPGAKTFFIVHYPEKTSKK